MLVSYLAYPWSLKMGAIFATETPAVFHREYGAIPQRQRTRHIHPTHYQLLLEIRPNLTSHEQKVCAHLAILAAETRMFEKAKKGEERPIRPLCSALPSNVHVVFRRLFMQ